MEVDREQVSVVGDSGIYGIPPLVAAAHELKSPLALMRQMALALESGDCSQKEIEILARRMTLTSERALRLTADLTRAARLEDSLFVTEPINPLTLLEDIADELEPLYRARGKNLLVTRRRRQQLAVANHDLLRRIIVNFVDNALHYSTLDTPVRLSSQVVNGIVRMGVRDYGPALPNGVWKKVNDNLGVKAQVLHARPESSGLGMYVAGKFAQAMGAKIGDTRHRDGVTFYVDLHASTQMRLL